MAKVLLPENQKPKTLGVDVHPHYERESNIFEAVINGSNAGVKVVVGIVALLLAVLGLVALVDMILGGLGGWINHASGLSIDWTLKGLLGYLFYPFTMVLGIPMADVGTISKIIGERAVLTEVTAYQDLAAVLAKGVLSSPRSGVIAAYALCGFAHVASMAIFVGGTAAMAPNQTKTLSRIAFRSLVAATLACLMTACVAGTFFTTSSILIR
jgi:concentrative nucleoside transporter, CNT family